MKSASMALAAVISLFVSLGCKPEIGDACDVNADCSATADRLCDTTQPGGYCTLFNCEPGTCPDEATCIGFRTALSTLPAEDEDGNVVGWVCADLQTTSRLQRTFCMRECESDGDCRSGYACIDMGQPGNPYGAVVVEGSGSGKVCAVPSQGEPLRDATGFDGVPGVCTGDPGLSAGGAAPAEGGAPTAGGAGASAGSAARAGANSAGRGGSAGR